MFRKQIDDAVSNRRYRVGVDTESSSTDPEAILSHFRAYQNSAARPHPSAIKADNKQIVEGILYDTKVFLLLRVSWTDSCNSNAERFFAVATEVGRILPCHVP
jgi:hypothetical protein